MWINQFDSDNGAGDGQDYAIAWWAAAVMGTSGGDYNGDNIVDSQDYTTWRSSFGTSVTSGTGADGNGDGVINSADYVLWRKALNAGSGSSLASVPEPSAIAIALVGLVLCVANMRTTKIGNWRR